MTRSTSSYCRIIAAARSTLSARGRSSARSARELASAWYCRQRSFDAQADRPATQVAKQRPQVKSAWQQKPGSAKPGLSRRCEAGGLFARRPSRLLLGRRRGPRGRAAALPRSCGRTATSASSRIDARRRCAISGTASGSGSSTSTYFCSEWIRSSLRSSGEIVSSAISRSATTGFLSLSRSIVSGAPPTRSCARGGWPAAPARNGSRPCRCSLRR